MISSLQPERAVQSSANLEGRELVPYLNPIPFEAVDAALAYDAETGVFTWKVNAAKNVKAGRLAGCTKAARADAHGNIKSYRYIRIGHEIPAARVAWLLHYGEWPKGKLFFEDGDSLNLRIKNIFLGNSLLGKYDMKDPGQRKAYMKDHRKAFPRAWRESHLMSNFGITLSDYAALAAEQDNKCAICANPETEMRNGKVKALAVDHDHATGKVRGLLCVACNTGLGKLGENRNVLLSAIRYLDKHSGVETASPNLTVLNKGDAK